MTRTKAKLVSFSPALPQLFSLLWYCLRHPRRYADLIPWDGSFIEGSVFLLTCLAIDIGGRIVLRIMITYNPVAVFQGTTEGVITLIVTYSLYLAAATLLFLLSKVLRGQASFTAVFRSLVYSSIVVIGFWVPFLRAILLLYLLYFLLTSLARANRYPVTMALFTLLTPILAVGLILAMLGLLHLNLLAIPWKNQ